MARLPMASGLAGVTATFEGEMRCVEPAEYWLWAMKTGDPPAVILNPLREFCYDAEASWCREQRAAGRCHLSEAQFQTVINHHAEDEDDMAITTTTSSNGRVAPAWEVWQGATGERSITVERTGQIRVSPAADRALGKPPVVQLLYSKSPRMIGVRAAPAGSQGAMTPKRKGDGLGFVLGGRAFLEYHAIEHEATRRWAARESNGVLAIELDSKPLTSRLGRKATAS